MGADWICTWGTEEQLSVIQFVDLMTAAYESLLDRQRQAWKIQRGSALRGVMQQEPTVLARDGSLEIYSVIYNGSELDPSSERPLELHDGALVICQADVAKYSVPAGI